MMQRGVSGFSPVFTGKNKRPKMEKAAMRKIRAFNHRATGQKTISDSFRGERQLFFDLNTKTIFLSFIIRMKQSRLVHQTQVQNWGQKSHNRAKWQKSVLTFWFSESLGIILIFDVWAPRRGITTGEAKIAGYLIFL